MYIAGIPNPDPDLFPPDESEEEDAHILVFDDGTFVLDNDWWLNEEAGMTMPSHVLAHLRDTRGDRRARDMVRPLHRRSVGLHPRDLDHRTAR